MPETGPVITPQQRPNPQILGPGQRGSYPVFFLRSTPPIITFQRAGATNTSFVHSAYVPVTQPLFFQGSRRIAAAPTVGTLKTGQVTTELTFTAQTAGTATHFGSAAVALSFNASVSTGAQSGSVSLAITFTVVTQNSAALSLTPESSDSLTLDPETFGGGLTLDPEHPADTLTLTPEI